MKYIIALLAIAGFLVGAIDLRSPYRKAVVSAVMIESGESTGSGVFVLDGTYVLTAAHVVAGKTDIVVHPSEWRDGVEYGPALACTVIRSDHSHDLALLKVGGKGIPMSMGEEPTPGDELIVIGNANAAFGFNKGHCRQVYQTEFPGRYGFFSGRVVDISTPVNFGDSGGPMVDSRGRLAGIVVSMDAFKNQTSFGVPTTEIRRFLKGVE